METLERLKLAGMESFLETHQHVHCTGPVRESVYKLIEHVLKAQEKLHFQGASLQRGGIATLPETVN